MNNQTTHLTKESLKLGTNKDEKPTHLDLFSGIGGFALAAGWAGFETIGFCDNEPYAQAVLKKHWPNVPIHGDIKTLDGTAYRGVTLLTGGFPCQPYSSSGKQRGKDDDRHLWPEMLRVIQQAKPSWVIGENVAGIINMELEQVCIDLEACSYEVEPIIIPACGVDAPHRRNRVWIIAGGGGDVADPLCFRNERLWKQMDNTCETLEGRKNTKIYGIPSFERDPANEQSDSQSFVGRVANGIPNRTHRLKGLGNAIVPQVAYQIIKGIRDLL